MAETNVQVFSGTVTATNLIRGVAEEAVRWNSQSETVFPQSATTRYYKIATLGATGEFANGGKLRISGTIGGFGGDSTTLIDAFVTSRGAAIKFGGTLSGYGGDPTGVVDIVVYLESNGTFGVWLKLLRYYTFDFIISGAQVSNNTRTLAVLPCPTTDTSVATPTGTLQGSVVDACSVVFTDDGNVGIGTNNPVGQLQVYGVGQATTTSFNQSGDLGGILTVKTSNGSAGDGGGIMFGANQGYFAAIKGTLSDGGDNTSGELRFCTRNPPSSSTMQVNMVMNRAGYVGIGTTDPYAPLEVHGADLTGQPVGTTGIISRHVAGLDGVLNIFGVAMSNGEETVGLQTQIDGRAWATDIAAGWNYGGDSRYNLILQPYKGNVGIGTTNPGQKLTINGATLSHAALGGEHQGIRVTNENVNYGSSAGIGMYVAAAANAVPGASVGGTLMGDIETYWANGTDAYMRFFVSPTNSTTRGDPKMVIRNNGNVGIGTDDPTSKLQVEGDIQMRSDDSLISGGRGDAFAYDGSTMPHYGIMWRNHTQAVGSKTMQVSGYGGIRCFTNGSERMTIRHSGNVGIGTIDPTGKFHVHGNIKAGNSFTTQQGYHSIVTCTSYPHIGGDMVTLNAIANDANARQYLDNYGNQYINMFPCMSGSSFYLYGRHGNTRYRSILGGSNFFTGQHVGHPEDYDLKSNVADYVGLTVCSAGTGYRSYNGSTGDIIVGNDAIAINESLPNIKLSSKSCDPSVMGVVSNRVDKNTLNTDGTFEEDDKPTGFQDSLYDRVRFNSVGEGALWVTDINGPIQNGDYVTTSNVAGYCMKQADDILHNYTVAKVTMPCDFNPILQPVKVSKKVTKYKDTWVTEKWEEITEDEYNTPKVGESQMKRMVTVEDGITIYKKQSAYQEWDKNPNDGESIYINKEYEEIAKDELGRTILENHPDGKMELPYKIRYLDASGNEVDEATHVVKAAFLGCTYHCG